jgi:RNA polymerase sigma factor (sigma-70 family)
VTAESSGSDVHQGLAPADATDRAAFDAMFRAYADRVFEYCATLLGDEKAAAGATQATFIAAYSLIGRLRNPRRMEAWLYALARRECTSKYPGRTELSAPKPDAADADRTGAAATVPDTAEASTIELPACSDSVSRHQATADALAALAALPERDRGILAAFAQLPERDREIVDLVYWRGFDRYELAHILGVSARRAAALLTVAEKNLGRLTERTLLRAAEPGSEHARSLLAVMPTTVWRRTVSLVFDDDQAGSRQAVTAHAGQLDADGFPRQPAPPGLRPHAALATSAVVIPAVAGLVTLGALGGTTSRPGLPAVRDGHHSVTAIRPHPRPAPAEHEPKASPHQVRRRARPAATSGGPQQAVPSPQPTGRPRPPSPSIAPITSAPATAAPSPTPKPTKPGTPSPTTTSHSSGLSSPSSASS